MKKRIFGIAFMAMSLMAFNGMAQSTANSNNGSTKTEQCQKDGKKCGGEKAAKDGKGAKGDRQKDGKRGDRQKDGNGEKKNRMSAFEGLNLTDAQKTKLQELDAKRQAERQQKMEARKAQKEQQKANKQNGQADQKDLAARKAEKQQNDSVRKAERVADMKEYLVQVKEIIGPDNYVKFLENVYVQGGAQKGKAMGQGQKGGKQQMAHNKGGKSGNKQGGKSGKGQKQGQRQQGKSGQKTNTAAVASI